MHGANIPWIKMKCSELELKLTVFCKQKYNFHEFIPNSFCFFLSGTRERGGQKIEEK